MDLPDREREARAFGLRTVATRRSARPGDTSTLVDRLLPADDPLWDAPNLYLSPHCSISPDAYDARLIDLLVESLERYVRGERLRNEADLAAAHAAPRPLRSGG
jgi:lactate dehydrogenase-like 2-hydroxyacid dehydrogenase